MALYEYNTLFNKGNKIGGIYKGGNLIWPVKKSGPDYTEPFYVENTTNANETLSIKKSASDALTLTIEYSTDKTNWSTLGTTSTTALTKTLTPGDKVYLRCNTNAWANSNRNVISGTRKVGGNIMSLLYGSNFTGQETSLPDRECFKYLFYNNTRLVDASKLLLPATTLKASCYERMFQGCTSLTTAPALPAANTLPGSCYNRMFLDCKSLTTAPTLPAAKLSSGGYNNMFNGCTSLNEITCFAKSKINYLNSTANWVSGVAATGTFYKKAGVSWPTGVNGIPSGWTVIEV